ncbi:ABC transporter substrate-binding protein [Cohnella terricola]|uniref:Extracellular solute-binding protein n=1 Tax=Cohnella terricola TaxID=1289167 RepID=A0A559JBB8_9BACL|nr:extracellular solute-binding protein [Cohnella terricola]TVX97153.1 extracellular solute-binding protein [Cohnella terricola]
MRYGKQITMLLGTSLLVGVASGCSTGGGDKNTNEKSALKVMYYDERSFYQEYGMLFSTLYPNIEIEVVSTQNVYEEGKDYQQSMREFMEKEKPDVLMLGTDEYRRMASEGKLYNLDSFIKKDKFDLEGIAPGILDSIRQASDGALYGLSPTFYSQVIYYNKDLFNKYGVSLPEDRMSWEKLFELAARFPTTGSEQDRVYGLKAGYQNELYYLGLNIGSTQGLSYINAGTKQLMINSDSWKNVFELADKAIKSETLYTDDPYRNNEGATTYEDYLLRDPFIGGKVAMTMEGSYLMNQIKEAKTRLKDKGIQNWDIVTMPVNPQNPDESTAMSPSQIFAIDASSANAEAAWKFVSYVNGDDFARVTSKLQNGNFPSRTKYIANENNINIAAFYSLKPVENNMYKDYDKIPQKFFEQFNMLTQEEFQKVKDGKATVSDALDNLQAKGQKILTEESAKEGQPSESPEGQAGSATESSSSGNSGAASEEAVPAQ